MVDGLTRASEAHHLLVAPVLLAEERLEPLDAAIKRAQTAYAQHKLDKEKGLSSERVDAVLPGLADGDDALANVTRLDTILEYLWHVHGINYYAGTELRWKDYHLRQERPRMIRREQVVKPAGENG